MLLFLIVAGIFLAASSLFYFKDPEKTKQVLSQSRPIRLVGLVLVAIGIFGFVFKSNLIRLMAIVFLVSGLWRVLFPMSSVLFRKRAFPRWVHGLLLALGAIAIFAILFFQNDLN